jgi:phosphate transport system permease protein
VIGDRIFLQILRAAAGVSLLILAGFFGQLLWSAWPALRAAGLSFFLTNNWDPNQQSFGAGAFIYGTLASSVLALLIAVPISVATALCLTEIFSARVAAVISFLVEMLAAIPSVVFGLWGVFVLSPLLRVTLQPFLAAHFSWIPLFSGPPLGIGLMSAGIILAIMITPTLTALSREVFLAIPTLQREAAMALGATRWETIRVAVLQSAKGGLWGAVILAWGRAIGETMAVTMVIGNRAQISPSLFAPAQTLAAALANEYAEATDDLHLSALAAVGLTLLLVSTVIHLGAKIWIRRGAKS